MPESSPSWSPTRFIRHEATLATSMDTAMVQTDAGRAHIKVMGNPAGPHTLACEYICARLADWFGVPVPEFSILRITDADVFSLRDGRMAEPGPAFASRTIKARPWSGEDEDLDLIVNPEDVTRLVICDTWIRNDDRYPPINEAGDIQSTWRQNCGNVLLTQEGAPRKKLRLVAVDFGRGLTQGHDLPGDLMREMDAIKNRWIYGLFPAFRRFVNPRRVEAAVARLREVTPDVPKAIMDQVPKEWEVSERAASAVCDYVYRRARFLTDTIRTTLKPLCYPQEGLFEDEDEGT